MEGFLERGKRVFDVERKLVTPVRAKAVQKGFGSLPAFGLFAGGKRECWMWKNANGDNFTFHYRGAENAEKNELKKTFSVLSVSRWLIQKQKCRLCPCAI